MTMVMTMLFIFSPSLGVSFMEEVISSPSILTKEGLARRVSKIWEGLEGLEPNILPMSLCGFFLLGGLM